jgi:hypothetical protein
MHRIVRVAALICLTMCLAAPLFAQEALITSQIPHGFLSKDNFVLLEKIVVLKKPVIELKEIPVHLYYNFDDSFSKPVQWPRFDLLLKERFEQERKHSSAANRDVFRMFYNKPKVSQEKLIRQEWERVLGIDVWYPYYKAKEVEAWVKEKCSVRVFKFKGRPEFSKRGFTYTFKARF